MDKLDYLIINIKSPEKEEPVITKVIKNNKDERFY